jgi:Ca-activated chloride channel family protein
MMHLDHPYALLLLLLPATAALYFLLKRRDSANRKLLLFSGPQGLLKTESHTIRRIYRLFFALTLIALGLLGYVVAKPYVTKPYIQKTTEGIDILITLDVSESMDADDFEPSRIEVARKVIKDFIRKREGDRIGVVIFSGDAVTKVPLTRDYEFLMTQVEDIRLREMKQGTAIGMGLSNAITRLRKSDSKTKVIILLTDGDSNVGAINPVTAAYLARQEGIKIYTIGIGKANRVVVPIYAYDVTGKRTQLIAQVPSYLNPELLQEIARITGGKAYMARDPGMLGRMLTEIDTLEKTKIKITRREQREERFLIPALAATLLLLLCYFLQETRFRKARPA